MMTVHIHDESASDRELVARVIARCFANWTIGLSSMSMERVLGEVRSKVGWTTLSRLSQAEIVEMIEQHAAKCGIPVKADSTPV